MKLLIILLIVLGYIFGTAIGASIFWGLGNLIIWVFKINIIWTFWHGLACFCLYSVLKELFD